jgi:hypothetical protein
MNATRSKDERHARAGRPPDDGVSVGGAFIYLRCRRGWSLGEPCGGALLPLPTTTERGRKRSERLARALSYLPPREELSLYCCCCCCWDVCGLEPGDSLGFYSGPLPILIGRRACSWVLASCPSSIDRCKFLPSFLAAWSFQHASINHWIKTHWWEERWCAWMYTSWPYYCHTFWWCIQFHFLAVDISLCSFGPGCIVICFFMPKLYCCLPFSPLAY